MERALGRKRGGSVRYGPRKIDLEILIFGYILLRDPDLHLPHPRLLVRAFVLVPLAEIAPDLAVGGVRIADALARLDRGGVKPFVG
jgi:2-amino-4-hydroxy-6-hydroxymethyldihydropteridine diphosphokinase